MLERIKRMRDQLYDAVAKVPRLVVSQQAIDKMVAASHDFIEDETGEAMIGLVMPDPQSGAQTVYILDTIAPDNSAVRARHTFQQGDARQDEIFYWLRENWRVTRDKRNGSYGKAVGAKWDAPLTYIGDWHKQPGAMVRPSGGDHMTAVDWLMDTGMDFLIAPILTIGNPCPDGDGKSAAVVYTDAGEEIEIEIETKIKNYIAVPQKNGTCVRIDFWYIPAKYGMVVGFLPIEPNIVATDAFPRLMPYGWHLENEARFQKEMTLLEKDGLLATMLLWDTDDESPLEICFILARVGSPHVLLVTTAYDFPNDPPMTHVAPLIGMSANEDVYDIFEDMWLASKLAEEPPGFKWTPESNLIDYIHAVEDVLGVVRDAANKPAAQETSVNVDNTGEEPQP